MQLIAIHERAVGAESQSVSARELHAFLGLSRDFNVWITDAIARARLAPGRDYLTYEDVVQLPSGAKYRKECALTIDAAKHIAMMSGTERGFEAREYFIECERRARDTAPRALTPAEMFLQSAQALVQVERLQAEQAAALVHLEERIDGIAAPFTACPSNAEPISKIRDRIYKQYGIPRPIIDRVLNELSYRPRPAGVVRNHREEAKGATYTVWWTKDVTALFKRFAAECQRATPALVAHPEIDRRFHLQAEHGVLV